MSRATKIALVVGALLVLLGGIIFAAAMMSFKWDFKKISTTNYQTNEHQITESFNDVSIVTDTADIKLLPSENSQVKVVCYEEENAKHAVSVKDGALTVEVVNEKKWYEHIGINFESPKVTVYLPEGEYGALSIKGDTGDTNISREFTFKSIEIEQDTGSVSNYANAINNIVIKTDTGAVTVEDVSAQAVDVSVSTGKVTVTGVKCEGTVKIGVSTGKTYIEDLKCKSFISSGDTGSLTLNSAVATEKFFIERSTGDVSFKDSDAAEIFVKTDTGDVTGTLLTNKVFIAETDTGKIEVPNSVNGGRCEITTDTGDIKISIA
ncbi:MAG: DUF4097 family beta strand repeat protein [Oscillospiraceae bacterium]|nr:DUF4097 family beta strand repeat protein [Oscillospiraceae bacterium]